MEFLETDFKSNLRPNRFIVENSEEEINRTIRLDNYPKLASKLWKLFLSRFECESLTIAAGQYAASTTTPRRVGSPVSKGGRVSERYGARSIAELAHAGSTTEVAGAGQLQGDCSGFLAEQSASSKAEIHKDLHAEIYDLWKNRQILEGTEMYLYIGEISHRNTSYPIFYIQLLVTRSDSDGSFVVEFSPVLQVNKSALRFVSRKHAEQFGKSWWLELPARQIFLGEFAHLEQYLNHIRGIVNEITGFFSIPLNDLLAPTSYKHSAGDAVISNQCSIILGDKSDEAMLNDYEQLLSVLLAGEGSVALDILSKLSSDYLFSNPVSFDAQVMLEYAERPLSDKLSFLSPVPLNKEQIQALAAVNKVGCDRIVIHGPPGTGKSHTITALVYEAILAGKAVLVVSDKKEALDVVEDKITQVLDKVSLDSLHNPVLRLGKSETTYVQIFKQPNYEKIRHRYFAFADKMPHMEQEMFAIANALRDEVDGHVEYNRGCTQQLFNMLMEYQPKYKEFWSGRINRDELGDGHDEFVEVLRACQTIGREIKHLSDSGLAQIAASGGDLVSLKTEQDACMRTIGELKNQLRVVYPSLRFLEYFDENLFLLLDKVSTALAGARLPLVGLAFASKTIRALNEAIRTHCPQMHAYDLALKHKEFTEEVNFYRGVMAQSKTGKTLRVHPVQLLKGRGFETILESLSRIGTAISILEKSPSFAESLKSLGIDKSCAASFADSVLLSRPPADLESMSNYLKAVTRLGADPRRALDEFVDKRTQLESRLVCKMTNIMDKSVLTFRDNYRTDTEDIKRAIKKRQRISADNLKKLVKAFPCLLVNLREIGDYLPLEANIFDLVIIDEASQVSIAQAFPAIIRGRKVVVLGDEKQYSNVKSHNASNAVNNALFSKLENTFRAELGCEQDINVSGLTSKLQLFNVKKSILSFMVTVANYECILKKHFRGYMELIEYSNDTFYEGSLEIMKIRGTSIQNVIQFHRVSADGKPEPYRNTNIAEAEYILGQLNQLCQLGSHSSVGVITPFREQQKLIYSLVSTSPRWEYLRDKCQLKVMTFDSCQGDEKDIVYYSLVEKEGEDILKYIFPVNLNNLNLEDEGSIKAQRLNVGFSRAKESVRFVLSKDITSYRGEIASVLRKYNNFLQQPDVLVTMSSVDPKSPMERMVLQYLYQTDFYKANRKWIEIIPQFGVGKYIGQLDRYAQIPKYRVDFLVIYRDPSGGKDRFVIVEYDGLEYHYRDRTKTDSDFGSSATLIEADIERQKAIEMYGYRFIRLNKFNLTDNPIRELDRRLAIHMGMTDAYDDVLEEAAYDFESMQNGDSRVCSNCRSVKEICEFYDESLSSLYGRVCSECKESPKKRAERSANQQLEKSRQCSQCGIGQPLEKFKRKRSRSGYGRICSICIAKCPKCSTKLVKRHNAFGTYYACTKCDSKRNYIE